MKVVLNKWLTVFTCCFLSMPVWSQVATTQDSSATTDKAHNEWLKQRFAKQHQALIPIVAVADIFFSCNKARKVDPKSYQLKELITEMDKNVLAEKLANCLGEDTMQSDTALNFGLFGCFHQQLAHLPKAEREQKMTLVKQAISSLSHQERKKSFTQCVTEQSIHYLK